MEKIAIIDVFNFDVFPFRNYLTNSILYGNDLAVIWSAHHLVFNHPIPFYRMADYSEETKKSKIIYYSGLLPGAHWQHPNGIVYVLA
jgi:hypothetical protein